MHSSSEGVCSHSHVFSGKGRVDGDAVWMGDSNLEKNSLIVEC